MNHDPTVAGFHHDVFSRLSAVLRRMRLYVFLDGLLHLLTATAAAAAVQLTLDRTFHLPSDMRAALLAAVLTVVLYTLWRAVVAPLRLRVESDDVAKIVENRQPELASRLISALQFAEGRGGPPQTNSPAMVRALIEQVRREARSLRFSEMLNHRRALWRGLGCTVFVLAGILAQRLAPETFGIWFRRNVLLSNDQWPQQTRLKVLNLTEDGKLVAPKGDDLDIQAVAVGVIPDRVDVELNFANSRLRSETMVNVGEGPARKFRTTLSHLSEPLRFRLTGGDDRTEWYEIELVDRPGITNVRMRITPPAYTQLAPYDLRTDLTVAEVLLGSEVAISMETNKPVVSAALYSGEEMVGPASASGSAWTATVRPLETANYHFVLTDAAGLTNNRPTRLAIRVQTDKPPRVRMAIAGLGDMITPEAVLPVELEFEDAYGLAGAELVYQVMREGLAPVGSPLTGFVPHTRNFVSKLRWDVGPVGVVAGERLSLMAKALDFDDISGPNEGVSNALILRVVSRDELLNDLARREQDYRQQFERTISAQEKLRGDLLTVTARLSDPEAKPADLGEQFAVHERQQRLLSSQCNSLRMQFEQIMTEMEINQLDTTAARKRLGNGVIAPMADLTKNEMFAASEQLRIAAKTPSAASASEMDPLQATILEKMRAIQTNMLKWEGFQEAVSMLREILQIQGNLNKETEAEIQRQAEKLFEE